MAGPEVDIALAAGKVLFSKISYDFFFKWQLDSSLLEILETQVNSAKALLNVAEMSRLEEGNFVDEWFQRARFAILDAEDLLDIIFTDINTEKHRSGDSPGTILNFKEKLRYKGKDIIRAVHPFKKLRETEMRDIIKKLRLITSQATNLGLDRYDNVLTELRRTRVSTSSDTDPLTIVGRSENEKDIMKLLNSREGNDDALRVISISGMGGVGKTTLASAVYNTYTSSMDKVFQVTGWVCVSDKFEMIHVMKSLLESITRGHSGMHSNLEVIQNELKRKLRDKRFLFVLDDIWSSIEDKWETLQNIFSVGALGSRIIVTTREENISIMLSTSLDCSYKLNRLSNAECWLVFQKHAFRNGESSAYPRLENTGKEIVSKCKGSPLAAKMIGRALYSKENDVKQWDLVLHSKIWNSTGNILPSLWLSYYHLPLPVKQCFAYFSIFPKDYVFSMEKMVRLWVSEGLVEKPSDYSKLSGDYEHLAQSYFKYLCTTFFIEPVSSGESGFLMHDLVHDLAEFVSKDLVVTLGNVNPESRRLPYAKDLKEHLNSVSIRKLRSLRTFLQRGCPFMDKHLFNNKVCDDLFPNFKFLRVLSLENYGISVLPASIGDMKLLRYLNLSGTFIEYLPQWISRLHNLQILHISNCLRLTVLPTYLCDLVNLRHLIAKYEHFEEIPDGFGKMANLRTLPEFCIQKGKSKKFSEFGELLYLHGKLELSYLNNVDDIRDVVAANFGNKEYLEELVLSWSSEETDLLLDQRVLDAIQPHTNLQRLHIKCFEGKRLSDWVVGMAPSFNNMESLCIIDCSNCERLPSLGTMPFLKHLEIERLDSLESLGGEFYGNTVCPFPALQELEISRMKILKTWIFPKSGTRAFSSLKELRIDSCAELTRIPVCFPSLSLLVIERCSQLVSVGSIGNLQYLKHVTIDGLQNMKSLDGDFYGDSCIPFPALETLRMTCMTALKHWCFPGGDKGGFCSLQTLHIGDCPELTDIPYYFPRLLKLEICSCSNLIRLDMFDGEGSVSKSAICGNSLQSIYISECDKLNELPKCFVNLSKVEIGFCKSLISVPGFQHVQKLVLKHTGALLLPEALIENCLLEELTITSWSPVVLTKLLSTETGLLTRFISLKRLRLSVPYSGKMNVVSDNEGMSVLKEDGDDSVVRLPPSLSELITDGCIHSKIIAEVCNLKMLKKMSLSCHTLESFPDAELPSELMSLKIQHCKALRTIPEKFLSGCSKRLEDLELIHCQNLLCLPECLSSLESLQTLILANCYLIQRLPSSSAVLFNRLSNLRISHCTELESLPEGFHKNTTLRTLTIHTCPNLALPEDGFPSMITSLVIKRCDKMEPVSNLKLSKLTSLTDLYLNEFPNTITLDNCIPESIEVLRIKNFPCLKSVTGVVATLKRLKHCEIYECPLLKKHKSRSKVLIGLAMKSCVPIS